MRPYAQEAEDLRLLFIAGIATGDDVVAWASRTILAFPEYDDDLTEISLGADLPRDEMVRRFRRVSEGADLLEAVRNLLGRVHRTLLSDRSRAEDLVRAMWDVDGEVGLELPRELEFLDGFRYTPAPSNPTWGSFVDEVIALTAPFDTGTSVPMSPSHSIGTRDSARKGKIMERLRRFFRRGRK